MNCSLRLAALAHCDEYFNENFAMKRCQHRSKQRKYADSRDFSGIMRKTRMEHGMTRIEHGLIENDTSGDQILSTELLDT